MIYILEAFDMAPPPAKGEGVLNGCETEDFD